MDILLALILTLAPSASAPRDPLAAASNRVEAIRGIEFRRAVERETRTRAQLREMLMAEIGREAGGADRYRLMLEAMLLVEPDERLIDRMLDAYEAQVLAWYDPVTGRFYELSDPAVDVTSIPMMKDGVLVHELTHALQDQWFGIGDALELLADDWDRAQAYHAVLEGEASLVMLEAGLESMGSSLKALLEAGVSLDQMLETMRSVAAGTFPSEVDPWFVESMKFPYIEGMAFVLSEWSRGGWPAVHAIHAHPPVSTEEVLRPELWRKRLADGARVRDPLVNESAETIRTTMGELAWRHLVGERAGAGIDQAVVTIDPIEGGHVVRLESTWDSATDAAEFEAAYRSLLASRGLEGSISREGRGVSASYAWPPKPRAIRGGNTD